MTADDFELEVGDDGSIHTTYNNPETNPLSDLPAIPRTVTGFDVGVLEAEGDKALMIVFWTKDEPAVLALPVLSAGALVTNLLDVMRREL